MSNFNTGSSMNDENAPLLTRQSQGSLKKVTFPSGSKRESTNPAVQNDKSGEKKTPSFAAGIAVALWITFLSSVGFSIVLNSIYYFIAHILQANGKDPNGATSWLGWAVSINSVGSFAASPVFGAWADRRSTREVLLVTLIVMVAGNLAYALAYDAESIWLLLAGRFVVGVACANYAVAQMYISYATNQKNRTLVMAFNSAANVFGFIIGPAMATALTIPALQGEVFGIVINSNNSPGYLAALLSLLGIVALIWLKEVPSHLRKRREKHVKKQGSMVYSASGKVVTVAGGSGFYTGGGSLKDVGTLVKMKDQIPLVPVAVSLFAYFSYTCSFTTFETIGSNYTFMYYNWDAKMNGIMFIVLGCVCIGSLFLLQVLVVMKIPDRTLLLLLTAFSMGGFGALMDFGTPALPIWRFWLGICMCSGGYAAVVAVLISVYSKVLEGLDQGMMMGWLSSASSVARIVGPIVASYIFQAGGDQRLFYVCLVINAFLLLCFIALCLFYRALTPREDSATKLKAEAEINNA